MIIFTMIKWISMCCISYENKLFFDISFFEIIKHIRTIVLINNIDPMILIWLRIRVLIQDIWQSKFQGSETLNENTFTNRVKHNCRRKFSARHVEIDPSTVHKVYTIVVNKWYTFDLILLVTHINVLETGVFLSNSSLNTKQV